jgi:hypothetical protein
VIYKHLFFYNSSHRDEIMVSLTSISLGIILNIF